MPTIKEQLSIFKRVLSGAHFAVDSPILAKALEFVNQVRLHPLELSDRERDDLKDIIQKAFGFSDADLETSLAGISAPSQVDGNGKVDHALNDERELWSILPTEGYLYDYAKYTERSEAPLIYHTFAAISAVGAIVNRRCWFDMTYYRLYPALGVILLGPSGIKKTTAANLVVDLLRETELAEVYSEKITPEALQSALGKNSCGLVYAPELTVFLGKQKYMEGIIPLLTRIMDHPDIFPLETKGGGKVILREVGTSILGCSTPDWFIDNTPEGTFGGGFVARNILICQEDCARVEPRPVLQNQELRGRVILHLNNVFQLSGEMEFTPEASRFYDEWYRSSKDKWRHPEIELLSTYYQRKADHVKRVAMNMHLAQHNNLTICEECFARSVSLMDWTEKFLTPMFKKMFRSTSGQDLDYVTKVIRAHGGIMDHSKLVRAVQYRLSAQQLRAVIASLKDAKLLEERDDKLQHCYIIAE